MACVEVDSVMVTDRERQRQHLHCYGPFRFNQIIETILLDFVRLYSIAAYF